MVATPSQTAGLTRLAGNINAGDTTGRDAFLRTMNQLPDAGHATVLADNGGVLHPFDQEGGFPPPQMIPNVNTDLGTTIATYRASSQGPGTGVRGDIVAAEKAMYDHGRVDSIGATPQNMIINRTRGSLYRARVKRFLGQ